MNFNLPSREIAILEDFLQQHFKHSNSNFLSAALLKTGTSPDGMIQTGGDNKGFFQLLESVTYSLFSGGKRFRPMVGFLLGKALNVPVEKLVPWLAAVECIHTYSLIHDDLPSMDNDPLRRGKPTNHILFGEATALLAGDALLTEAFTILSESYKETPEIGLSLVRILSSAAGMNGMVGGQAMDLAADLQTINLESAELIHHLKTGALICSVTQGVAILAKATIEDESRITKFGLLLGLAFQLKDDLLDFDPKVIDPKNIASHIGFDQIRTLLKTTSDGAHNELRFLGENHIKLLVDLIEYNIQRTQ